MRALLDVNVLIALLDAGHAMHSRAMVWLEREAVHGWASCPITQNGVVRIMSQPGYPTPRAAGLVAERLALAYQAPEHNLWAADVSLLAPDVINCSRVMWHPQVTDAYLLALAVRNQGRLVTFDQRNDPALVVGGSEKNLNLIG